MKRGIFVSDMHCGHLCGLTPPPWQTRKTPDGHTKRGKWAALQAELWAAYLAILRRNGPFDFGLSVGDAIDGKGDRSGSAEQITADREEQAEMAVACHDAVRRHARPGFRSTIFGVLLTLRSALQARASSSTRCGTMPRTARIGTAETR